MSVTSFSSPVGGSMVSVTVSPGVRPPSRRLRSSLSSKRSPSTAAMVSFGSSTPSAGMVGATTSTTLAHRDLDVVAQPFERHLGGDLLGVVHHPQVHLAVLLDVAVAQHLLAGVDVDVVVEPALASMPKSVAWRNDTVV